MTGPRTPVDPGDLVRGVQIVGEDAAPVDLRIVAGVIDEVGPDLPRLGSTVHDAAGLWAMPGLWDHHVHVGQTAMLSERLDTSRAGSADELYRLVARAISGDGGDTVQGFGHRSATWPEPPTVSGLDRVTGDRPVVLISGDAHHGLVNTAVLRRWGLPDRDDPIVEDEWFALFDRFDELPGVGEAGRRGVSALVREAHSRGVVGIVDFEWADNVTAWRDRFAAGLDTLRVRTAVYADRLDAVIELGLRTGSTPTANPLLTMGPLKIISDGSLNTRTAFCCEPYAGSTDRGLQNTPPAELRRLLQRADDHGLEVAVHAIGDAAVADALDAFAVTGAHGSIEHAQLIRTPDVTRLAELGIIASVQPAHLLDDRDVSEVCWPDRGDRCFVFASMLDAGVTLRFGSDSPVAPLDPWLAMAAAVHRSADRRPAWTPAQQLSPTAALHASTAGVNRLRAGGPGDVVLVTADPTHSTGDSAADADRLRSTEVIATFVSGRLVFQS